jgi:arylsulfatase
MSPDRLGRRDFLKAVGAAGAGAWMAQASALSAESGPVSRPPARGGRPNIILFLGDDLGRSDLGCYGGGKIRTPSLDALAAGGVRFSRAYSGSPVCAPSRCVLLTGLHTGHAHVRDNLEIQPEGQTPLPAGTATFPRILREAGYATGCVGKWGLGFPGSTGTPDKMGFDLFFGYNCQRLAHNHYPASLWRNGERVALDGNAAGPAGGPYAPDLFEREALDFIRGNRRRPFFLFYATTVPHLALQVPDDSLAEYAGAWPETPYDGGKGYLPHPKPRAAYAAMVSRLDRSVGRVMALLRELRLEEDTLVLFASDNGATYDVGGFDAAFFQSTGGLRAAKGSVYEGGIRVPLIGRWPGRIRPGRTSEHVCGFQDLFPTILEAAGLDRAAPAGLDGLSFAPELLGRGRQPGHESLYMEFTGYGGQQMAREGEWKGVRRDLLKNPAAPMEIYDLAADPLETRDLAADKPDIVRRLREIMAAEHRPSPVFPFPALDGGA